MKLHETTLHLADFIDDAIVMVSPEGFLAYANPAARRVFGLPPEGDLSGFPCSESLQLNICRENCPRSRPEGSSGPVNDYFVNRRGCDLVFCVNTSPVTDGKGRTAGYIHSIKNMELVRQIVAQQHRTQEELAHSRRRAEAILESVADGVFTVDREGRLTHFSASMERITGYSAGEVLGKSCREALRGDICEKDCPIRWTFLEGKRVEHCRETVKGRDGGIIPIFVSTAPVGNGDGATEVVCSVTDRTEVEALRRSLDEVNPFPELVGRGKRMKELFGLLESLATTDATVLIEGETGTGKELVARAIHQRSSRAGGPFVPVNCSALAPSLLESELFGHAKGAFTGALRDRVGKFEAAEGGTLFLDEVSEISPDIQVKLLRFLQSREFERVGETGVRKVDVRVVAATNRNLKERSREGAFREDLFYRLNVFPLKVPALKKRKEDIPLLVEHFLRKHARLNSAVQGVSTRAMKNLVEYGWPGNVRELENAVMYALASCPGKRIERACLPPDIRKLPLERCPEEAENPDMDLETMEKKRVVRALVENNWKVEEAARFLGYSRVTLWRRMKKLQVIPPNRS